MIDHLIFDKQEWVKADDIEGTWSLKASDLVGDEYNAIIKRVDGKYQVTIGYAGTNFYGEAHKVK